MNRTIVFDLDGTLLDSRRRLYTLFCELYPDNDLTSDQYWDLKRFPHSHDHILRTLGGVGDEEIEIFNEMWLARIESDRFLGLDTLQVGADSALQDLKSDFRLVLLTARQLRAGVLAQLAALRIDDFFEEVLVTGRGRTKSEVLAGSGLALSHRDFLLGDTGDDVVAARAAGVRAAVVSNGFRRTEYLSRYDPDELHADLSSFVAARYI